MKQTPSCDAYLLRWCGDALTVTCELDSPCAGRAVVRTNLGGASIRRREIIAETETGETPLAKAWHDVPMVEVAPGHFSVTLPLDEVGVFSAKTCFFPASGGSPIWPEGNNFHVKVAPAHTRRANAIYTAFPRQFGGARYANPESADGVKGAEEFLDRLGFNVIPPSGTLRDVVRALPHIMDAMRFRIVQLLPVFPVPATFARMGRYGCPFAATDFLSVDPALAEFDRTTTPLDQFTELADAVHARGGYLYLDLPANHTGWAATLQTHHPDWYHRAGDGRFISPGAWGVEWADLVELDYTSPDLRAYMAEVFLFWCRHGVDGFRCDAGYMIPEATWTYIVARVREEYPDTVFMLEGLGGSLEVTDGLLSRADLDWAYSELFQTYDRGAFEWYLPGAITRAEKYGALVHFAETHDNDRLAKKGHVWARMRVALAALLSHEGAWGIANGVEWFATEKIDVHGSSALNWGAAENLVAFVRQLNDVLATHPAFGPGVPLKLVTRGDGNTLAVWRGGAAPLLVLANLDCEHAATIQWDTAYCSASEVLDILTGQRLVIDSHSGVRLEKGEVKCLAWTAEDASSSTQLESVRPVCGHSVTFTYPDDLMREVCVPAGCVLRVVAPCAFRVEVKDGEVTRAVARSSGNEAVLKMPPYAGLGTRADRLALVLAVYAPEGVKRACGTLLVLPPAAAARVKTMYSGDEIRRTEGLETVLGNGANAMARVKLAWGEIRSQYDALFAANTDPNVPADRLVLWTRCRCWLQHEGYSRELNRDVIESFLADPAGHFARWVFRVPCGLGAVVRFAFTLSLAAGENAACLAVRRLGAGTAECSDTVRLVFRPDLEWRSIHASTKAMGAVEDAFRKPEALTPHAHGFTFHPYGGKVLHVTVEGGDFHAESEWTYCVAHAEEAARGQEPLGDLYSPGWISCDLAPAGTASLMAAYGLVKNPVFAEAPLVPAAAQAFPEALRAALRLYMVKRDDVKTVLAGYPWFLDWGRDTFIFLRGAIAGGYLEEAKAIVLAFARFEENGTLPNIIYGTKAGNRDTTDAQLWFIVAVRDLVEHVGIGFLQTDCTPEGTVWSRTLADVLVSIADHYIEGTPNGIRMDPASALIWSPSHFTWMDTNYPACTPRCGYPVEIQALWIAALRFLGSRDFPRLIPTRGGKWLDLAARAGESLVRYYTRADVEGLADCLDAPNGEVAEAAKPDFGVRPNQLFAVTLGALPSGRQDLAQGVLNACERLLVPGGVRSLAFGDTRYQGVYAGDEDTCRKPAYHNGTVWAWPFPAYAEAAVKAGRWTKGQALSLLASAVENLNAGCVCHLSEVADGDAPHAQKGCRAQGWSDSELLRVWLALGGPGKGKAK